jgi:hypothetical protein
MGFDEMGVEAENFGMNIANVRLVLSCLVSCLLCVQTGMNMGAAAMQGLGQLSPIQQQAMLNQQMVPLSLLTCVCRFVPDLLRCLSWHCICSSPSSCSSSSPP